MLRCYERIILLCGNPARRRQQQSPAEIMFVPDKVMNREETHLAGDRRGSNLRRAWKRHAHMQSLRSRWSERIRGDLTATRQSPRRHANTSDWGLIGCQQNFNPAPPCAESIRRFWKLQKHRNLPVLRQQMRSGIIWSVFWCGNVAPFSFEVLWKEKTSNAVTSCFKYKENSWLLGDDDEKLCCRGDRSLLDSMWGC